MTVRFLAASFSVLLALPVAAQQLTPPERALGFTIGADYRLATYSQFESWWRTLDRESDRMVVQEIGKTAEGRPQLMAIVTSPENHRRLDRYREIARRLALEQDADSAAARQLAAEGKAVVWIDGGLHATETLGAQQLIELVYQMASQTDPETLRILDDVILLAVAANPDGMDLVAAGRGVHGVPPEPQHINTAERSWFAWREPLRGSVILCLQRRPCHPHPPLRGDLSPDESRRGRGEMPYSAACCACRLAPRARSLLRAPR